MKCFSMGFAGALLLLICALFINSQYSDYRARAETNGWLVQAQAIQSVIEQNATKQKSLINAGRDADKKVLQATSLDVIEITESSTIILRGGRDGQIVALIPSFSDGRITWHCVGGSAKAMPNKCARP